MKLQNHNSRVSKEFHIPMTDESKEVWANKIANSLMIAMCGKSQVSPQHVADAYCGHVRNGSVSDFGCPTQFIKEICEKLSFDNESDDLFLEEAIKLTKNQLKETNMEVPEWLYHFATS